MSPHSTLTTRWGLNLDLNGIRHVTINLRYTENSGFDSNISRFRLFVDVTLTARGLRDILGMI